MHTSQQKDFSCFILGGGCEPFMTLVSCLSFCVEVNFSKTSVFLRFLTQSKNACSKVGTVDVCLFGYRHNRAGTQKGRRFSVLIANFFHLMASQPARKHIHTFVDVSVRMLHILFCLLFLLHHVVFFKKPYLLHRFLLIAFGSSVYVVFIFYV